MVDQEVGNMNIDSIEMLKIYEQSIEGNLELFNKIHKERYVSKLSLKVNDPINLQTHLGQTEEKNKRVKKDIERSLNFMHITYYKKGMDWLKWGDKNKAKQFFEKSISEDDRYAPPYYELAKTDFNNKKYNKVMDMCHLVLNKLKPDTDTRYNCVKLSESIIYTYIDSINSLIDEKEYDKALSLLNKCENYATTMPGVKKFEEFDEINEKLFNVYYSNFAEQINKQIEKKQLYKALNNTDSLIAFREAHARYIQNAKQEHIVLNNLYDKWIEQGLVYQKNNMSDSSLRAFTQAAFLCNKYETVYCSDSLNNLIFTSKVNVYNDMIKTCDTLLNNQLADSTIVLLAIADSFRVENKINKNKRVDALFIQSQQIKYNQCIELGYNQYLKNKTTEALGYYEQAKAIDEKYTIAIDTSLRSKIVEAAQSNIITLCTQGEILIEAFNFSKATLKLKNAEYIYESYNMSSDEKSREAINSLKNKIETGKCEEKQHLYNIQVLASKKFIEKKEFIHASNALDKAKDIANNDGCELVDSITNRIAKNISAMLYYQRRMVKIDNELSLKKYHNTINDYINLTAYYIDSCENNFGIEHMKLYDYISTNKNSGLIDFGVRYYVQLNKEDTALLLLNILHSRRYIVTWSKQSQIELGVKLARQDIEQDLNQNPEIKILEYTNGKKWYRYLKRAYLKEWNSLKYEIDLKE